MLGFKMIVSKLCCFALQDPAHLCASNSAAVSDPAIKEDEDIYVSGSRSFLISIFFHRIFSIKIVSACSVIRARPLNLRAQEEVH